MFKWSVYCHMLNCLWSWEISRFIELKKGNYYPGILLSIINIKFDYNFTRNCWKKMKIRLVTAGLSQLCFMGEVWITIIKTLETTSASGLCWIENRSSGDHTSGLCWIENSRWYSEQEIFKHYITLQYSVLVYKSKQIMS